MGAPCGDCPGNRAQLGTHMDSMDAIRFIQDAPIWLSDKELREVNPGKSPSHNFVLFSPLLLLI